MTEKNTVAKIAAGVGVATTVWGWYTKGREWWTERTRYTATLNENSFVYSEVLEWLNDQVSPRSVALSTNTSGVRRHYNAGGENTVKVGAYNIRFRLDSPQKRMQSDSDLGYIDDAGDTFLKKIVFTAHDPRAIDALTEQIEYIISKRETRPRRAGYYTIGQWGWENITPSRRTLDTVFLPRGEKERLTSDLDNFFAAEDRFEIMGLPWHRGYLFHGPPGNGKSSLAKAIVDKYKLNMYNLPLSGVKDDNHLQNCFASLEPRSVLLLEDIDIFRATKREQANGLTLAGLLNCLDGVSTPHGLITILTTNHMHSLDPAMIRPGRVDFRLELGEPSDQQVLDMFQHIYGEPLGGTPKGFVSMAALTDVFKRNAFSAEDARKEIISPAWVVYND